MGDWDVVSTGKPKSKSNDWDVVSIGKTQTQPQADTPFSFKEMANNIPSSAMNFAKGIGTAVMHPVDTGLGLVRTAAGGLGALAEKVAPGSSSGLVTPEDDQAWDAMKDFMIKRYGSVDAFKQTVQNDPIGFSADLSSILGGAGGALGKAGDISGIGAISKAGDIAQTASEFTNPINAARGTARLAGQYVAKPVSEGVAGLSGIEQSQPGTLEAEFKNPSTIFAPGKKAVSSMYENAKTEPLPEGISDISKNIELVDTAKQLDKEGSLTPEIALEARKALSAVEGRVPDPYFRSSLDILNKVAKPVFGEQDIAYKKAAQAEAMRNFFPINKDKSASLMRTIAAVGAGGAVAHYGGINPLYGLALAPYVQGGIAGLLGTGAKAASPVAKMLIDHPELANVLGKTNQLGLAGQINQ